MNYDWDWGVIWQYYPILLDGLIITIILSLFSIVSGTILGFTIGFIVSYGQNKFPELRVIILFLIDIVRSLPLLILILLLYYASPYFFKVSPFWIAYAALTINLSAFVADVLRGAIEGVPRPLLEAGYALGMTNLLVARRIIIPEAIRQIIPTLALLYIDILKLSSLASVIAVNELVHVSTEISAISFRSLEIFVTLAIIYIALILPFSYFSRRLENAKWLSRRS
jgi:polar amino acid transport system permease protein